MKKVLGSIILPAILLLSRLAAGQAAAGLDEQMFQAIEKGEFATVLQLLEKGAHINARAKTASRRSLPPPQWARQTL